MYISITFEDRANPYTRYCRSIEELEETKTEWGKHYILEEVKCTPSPYGENYFYIAKRKKEAE